MKKSLVIIGVMLAGAVFGVDRYVPSEGGFLDVLGRSTSGDVVHVAKGTYDLSDVNYDDYRHLWIPDGVTLLGETDDPADVVLAGNKTRRVVGMGADAVLRNVTVKGGETGYQGGGICTWDEREISEVFTVSNCVVADCSAVYEGGGIHRGLIIDTVITNCSVSSVNGPDMSWPGVGGGVYGATLIGCTISGCSAAWGGGGLSGRSVVGSDQIVPYPAKAIRCTFLGNYAPYGGGACAYAGHEGAVEVYDSYFKGNYADNMGGACHGVTVVSNCTIEANQAGGWNGGSVGGGASNTMRMYDSVIKLNYANYGCGLKYNDDFKAAHFVSNCVVCSNHTLRTELDWNASSSGYGGAGVCGYVTICDSDIFDNEGRNIFGGGTAFTTNINCRIYGNIAAFGGGSFYGKGEDCVYSNNATRIEGAAGYLIETVNCIVTANHSEDIMSGQEGNARGVLFRGHHRGTLVYGNSSPAGAVVDNDNDGSAIDAITLENCTIADNDCGENPAVRRATIVNTVVTGHKVNVADLVSSTTSYTENEPLYSSSKEFAYMPSAKSPLVGTGTWLPWMEDAVDIYGHKLAKGNTADIGAVVHFGLGLMILIK